MSDNYKGFELFSDIEDAELRTRNRAVVMANIASDHTKNKKISPKGASLILGYFLKLPEGERKMAQDKFQSTMNERGFALAS